MTDATPLASEQITQEDRRKASAYQAWSGDDMPLAARMLSGAEDDHPLVQAFAWHRVSALTTRIARDQYPEIIQAARWMDADHGTPHFEPGVGFIVDDPDGLTVPNRWLPHLDRIEAALAALDHTAPHPLDVDTIDALARDGKEPSLHESAAYCFVSGEHTPVSAMANSSPDLFAANQFLNERCENWVFDPTAGFAALSASPAPVGWKLVPIEPTQAQHSAGNRAQDDADQTDARKIYTAMIAASPAPSGQGVASELIRKWHAEWLSSLTGHWGDVIEWGTARVIARRIDEAAAPAPAPSCAPGEVERRTIAALIYPEAFAEPTAQQDTVYRRMSHEDARTDAFARADRILAALSPQGLDAKEGGKRVAFYWEAGSDIREGESLSDRDRRIYQQGWHDALTDEPEAFI